MFSQNQKGYLSVLLAAAIWASSGAIGKVLLKRGLTPYDLVQTRLIFAAFFLGIFLLFWDRKRFIVPLALFPELFVLGAIVMALVQFTYFYAISQIQLVAAVLLQYQAPILVALYSMVFWNEKFSILKVSSIILAIFGCYLVVGAYNTDFCKLNIKGIAGGIAAAFSYAGYTLWGERLMRRCDPWTVVFYSLLFAALTWNIIHPPFNAFSGSLGVAQWVGLIYIATIGGVGSYGLYFLGVNYIRSTRAMITATAEPMLAGALAYLFLGESMDLAQVLGAAFVILAIVTLQLVREDNLASPENIRSRHGLKSSNVP
ncbi:MAG: DMT family transporter [Deltaproteobacteria bacterium]|nr:DMT family transporter [Deltaproteobacteria bacterium]